MRARAAAESSPRWTRDVARLARAASLVVSPRRAFGAGAAAAAASCNSAPQLPALKQASSSSGGSRVSPGARKSSIRGARQNSFHPRASSPSHAGCTASRRPARSAVRRAPRMRGGADCSVRTRCRQVDWRSIASRAERPRRMPASAAALTCWRRVPVGLECACCVLTSGRASGAVATGGSGTAAAAGRRPRPRPRRPRPAPPRTVEARARIAAAAKRVSLSSTGSSSVGGGSGAVALGSRCMGAPATSPGAGRSSYSSCTAAAAGKGACPGSWGEAGLSTSGAADNGAGSGRKRSE